MMKDIFKGRPRNKGKLTRFPDYRSGDLLFLDGISASDKLDAIEIKLYDEVLEYGEQCFYFGSAILREYYQARPEDSWRYGICGLIRTGVNKLFARYVKSQRGLLHITSERFFFTCWNTGKNFSLYLDDIVNVTVEEERMIIRSTYDDYVLESDDMVFIRDLILLMNMAHEEYLVREGLDE